MLTPEHHRGTGPWGTLKHSGANGILVVLQCLRWWVLHVREFYRMQARYMVSWLEAVEDVNWGAEVYAYYLGTLTFM